MKQRFSSLDVKVIAHELQGNLVSLRVSNVYDLSSKILLFKFAKPDNKQQLVIDNGFRCHLTDFARTTAAAPSAFVARLRKHLKTRRLTSVSQIGTDRVLEFQFSDGQYRLFLEFFASGNIILTDAELKILAISRNVSEGEGQEPQRIGSHYSLDNRQNYPDVPALTKERITKALQSAVERSQVGNASAKKIKAKPGGDLRKGLAVSIAELPPVLVEHILQANNFDVSLKPVDILKSEELLDELVRCLIEARDVVENITNNETCTGYIFAKKKPGASSESNVSSSALTRDQLLYEDFHPFLPKKLKNDPSLEVLEFQGYNRTVDEFFSSLEGQKLESRLQGREEAAKRKLEAARQDQAKRVQGLQDAQAMNHRKAAAIEANVERVQEAMDAVNGLISQGMDWVDIGKLVEREKKRNNTVAEIINLPLKLSENMITLSLAEEEFEDINEETEDNPFETDDSDSEDEESKTITEKNSKAAKCLTVDIFLNLSPWSNAREYYEEKRSAAVKEEKTQLQAVKALKSTEQKITEDLKKGLKQEKALLQPIRRQMWFEKFTWFISSDGYLVIGGKDSQQNEILYKKYLRKGDVYCHADLQGAASIVIKNDPHTPDAPIPPATLSQAGTLCVCSSEAWDSKAGMSAWWVNANQVSKSTPSGEYLPAGSFIIQGKKNYLPPAQLLLGLGIMFKISEESKAKHVKHRLHDTDSAIGSEIQGHERDYDVEPVIDDEHTDNLEPEEEFNDGEHHDDGVSSDSDGDNQQNYDKRANPLQDMGNNDHSLGDIEHKMPKLTTSEQSSNNLSDEESEQDMGDEQESTIDEQTTELIAGKSDILSRPQQPAISKVAAKGTAPVKRGQKGKAKKIAQKYRDQDDEDRAAAEALIGAVVGKQRAEAEAVAKAQRLAEMEDMKLKRRAQNEKKQKEGAEQEEIRRIKMDEGIDVTEPEEAEKQVSLDALVGTPLPGDEILEAVPVCAPWNALSRFKYKAKMQPGAVKKSKAVKEVFEKWKADSMRKGVMDESASDNERMWPREVELIKAFKPEEVFNCVPVSKVRVMTTGGSGTGPGGGGGRGRKGKSGSGGRGKGRGGRKD